MRSSRLAPLAKCPRDTIILNWVIWARLRWEGKELPAGFASSFVLGAVLQPWGFLGKKRGNECKLSIQGMNKLAAPHSGGRLRRKGVKTINPGSWADRRYTPPTWQMHQTDWLAVKEISPKQITRWDFRVATRAHPPGVRIALVCCLHFLKRQRQDYLGSPQLLAVILNFRLKATDLGLKN